MGAVENGIKSTPFFHSPHKLNRYVFNLILLFQFCYK